MTSVLISAATTVNVVAVVASTWPLPVYTTTMPMRIGPTTVTLNPDGGHGDDSRARMNV